MKPIELKCYFLEDEIADELNDMGVTASLELHRFTKALFLNIDCIEPFQEDYTIVSSGRNNYIADIHYDALSKILTEQWNKENSTAVVLKQKTLSKKLVFDKNASAMKQVLFGLEYIGKVSKIGEIENAIRDFDKGLNTPLDKLKRADKVEIYNPTGSNHTVYYGLKEWFVNKELKENYKTI